jgi:protein-S-isoprenylcysteine O-methyltransferase Ste14
MRFFAPLYGVLAFAAGMAVSAYQIAFVGGFFVPKTIDKGCEGTTVWLALLINVVLMTLFGLQHSLMARDWFKRWWTRTIPEPIERSTYVFAVGAAYGLLFWLWQPITAVVWDVETPVFVWLIYGVFVAGWVLVLWSSHLIDPIEVWGLRQTVNHFLGRTGGISEFKVSGPYRFSRHPVMLGLIMAFWATPRMTVGHLEFAIVMSSYALIATIWEERDLIRDFPSYADYRASTPMLFPLSLKWFRQ